MGIVGCGLRSQKPNRAYSERLDNSRVLFRSAFFVRLLCQACVGYLQAENFFGLFSDFGLAAHSNRPKPDDFFAVGDNQYFFSYPLRHTLVNQKSADLFFLSQAQRNKPVTIFAHPNEQRRLYFLPVKPFDKTGFARPFLCASL